MFTGIIEKTARVLEKSPSQLILERPKSFSDLKRGSSIAVSGVCLTVVELMKERMSFDVVPETLKRTTLGSLKVGDRVNLERALKVGDRFEGHIVLGHADAVGCVEKIVHPASLGEAELRGAGGHVDGVGKIGKVSKVGKEGFVRANPALRDESRIFTISFPPTLKNLLVPKGSIAIDGVSLTITSLDKETFSVALIPHTLEETTLGSLNIGDSVNLEADVLGKYAAHSR